MAEKKRRARGEGSIHQRKDGAWEARFVVGVDPGTGKDIRKSVYAKTQRSIPYSGLIRWNKAKEVAMPP